MVDEQAEFLRAFGGGFAQGERAGGVEVAKDVREEQGENVVELLVGEDVVFAGAGRDVEHVGDELGMGDVPNVLDGVELIRASHFVALVVDKICRDLFVELPDFVQTMARFIHGSLYEFSLLGVCLCVTTEHVVVPSQGSDMAAPWDFVFCFVAEHTDDSAP